MPTINEILEERQKDYGSPAQDFLRVQRMFGAWMQGREINRDFETEALIRHTVYMILVKLSRLAHNPRHVDSRVDIGGYMECLNMAFHELDMARAHHTNPASDEHA